MRLKAITLFLMLFIFVTPLFASPNTNIDTGVNEILTGIKSIEDGLYLAGVTLLLTGFISLLKIPALWRINLFAQAPKRFRILIPLGLGLVVAFLNKFIATNNWSEALFYLWTGPSVIIAHEVFVHLIGGKPHKQ